MNLGNDKALWLLFTVPALLIPAYIWCFWRKAKALKVLASIDMLKKINVSVSLKKQIFKAFLLVAAFISIVLALTEPRWNPQTQKIKRRGRDVCILLDTSHSMLAEDIKPSRLERSKIAIRDLLEKLQGDRIAIVTFAGNATVKCPLTQDYAFVRMVLADISTESTSRGGTMIGDAIRKATEDVFDRQSREYKDIILITDGEDHDSFPVQAAEKAATEGIRIIAIGLGDENQGSRIPITGENGEKTFMKYKGQEVWSKLDADTLRKVVYATNGGKYLSVEPGTTLDLGQIYEGLIASAEKRELESTTMMTYDEKFQIFLALGLGLIALETLTSERKKMYHGHLGRGITGWKPVILLISLVLITAQAASAASVHNTVRQGNNLYNKEHFNEAIKEYDQALTDQPQVLEPKFNKANCYFQLDDLAEAINLYNEVAAESKDMEMVAKAKYNLGNSYFQRGSKQKDSNLQKALEDLQTSIVCWRSALSTGCLTAETDPENDKAAKNIEVARLIIKDIIDQLNKQKEQQQQQAAKQKQLQEKLKELAEQQKALAKQTQEIKEQEEKGQIDQQQAMDNYKKQAEEQSQLKKETEQTSQQMQQQDPNTPQPPQMQQAAQELEQAMDKQSEAETKLKASDGDTAKKSQDKAAEHLENALKALSQENQQNQQKQQQQQQEQTQQTQEPNQPSEEQQQQQEQKAAVAPDATAQEILDKEQNDKKQRQILQRAGYQKVEKDW